MAEGSNVRGFRHIENVPPGAPYIVAWFEGGEIRWAWNGVTSGQLTYFGARLLSEAVSKEPEPL